jgi:hypothetical protein
VLPELRANRRRQTPATLRTDRLVSTLNRSRKGVLLPQTYKAMCRQCGEIVQDRLGNDEALRCRNEHFVAPTIARDTIVKPRPPGPGLGDKGAQSPDARAHTRRQRDGG